MIIKALKYLRLRLHFFHLSETNFCCSYSQRGFMNGRILTQRRLPSFRLNIIAHKNRINTKLNVIRTETPKYIGIGKIINNVKSIGTFIITPSKNLNFLNRLVSTVVSPLIKRISFRTSISLVTLNISVLDNYIPD